MSLAALKRRLRVGTVVALDADWTGGPQKRVVSKKQANGVAFTILEGPKAGKESWLYWPKAKDVAYQPEKNRFDVIDGSYLRFLSYEIVEG